MSKKASYINYIEHGFDDITLEFEYKRHDEGRFSSFIVPLKFATVQVSLWDLKACCQLTASVQNLVHSESPTSLIGDRVYSAQFHSDLLFKDSKAAKASIGQSLEKLSKVYQKLKDGEEVCQALDEALVEELGVPKTGLLTSVYLARDKNHVKPSLLTDDVRLAIFNPFQHGMGSIIFAGTSSLKGNVKGFAEGALNVLEKSATAYKENCDNVFSNNQLRAVCLETGNELRLISQDPNLQFQALVTHDSKTHNTNVAVQKATIATLETDLTKHIERLHKASVFSNRLAQSRTVRAYLAANNILSRADRKREYTV
jgi:hypothetical protein